MKEKHQTALLDKLISAADNKEFLRFQLVLSKWKKVKQGWPGSITQLIFIALSLASTHYFGFMSKIPFEITSIVTLEFLPAFIGAFVFYTLLCYTIAKVVAFFFSQLVFSAGHTLAAFTLWLRRHWPKIVNRSATKLYREAIQYERPAYNITLGIVFLILFNISYLELFYTSFGEHTKIFIFIAAFAILLKIGFLARSPRKVVRRLRDEKRVAYRRQLTRASIYFGASLAVAFTYYAGILRFEKLQKENPTTIESKTFKGNANILLKSGNSFLALRQTDALREYIYFNEHNSISLKIESGPAKVPNVEP